MVEFAKLTQLSIECGPGGKIAILLFWTLMDDHGNNAIEEGCC